MIGVIGAGTYVGGSILNSYGQNKALTAMREVWADAQRRNQGFDDQLNQRQQQAMSEVNPNATLGLQEAAELNGQMDTSARQALAAIQANAGRRKGNVEGKAVAKQRQQGTLAQLLRSGKLQATLAGLQQGGQNTGEVGRRLGIDSRMIGDDARMWAGLASLFEDAAQRQGSAARRVGGAMQGLGQAGMMYGMSQSGSGGGSSGMAADAGGVSGMTPDGPYDYVGTSPTYWQLQPGAV